MCKREFEWLGAEVVRVEDKRGRALVLPRIDVHT